MGFTSIWHWIIVLAVVLILFARPGKISGIMGDFGKGLRSFKEGVKSPDKILRRVVFPQPDGPKSAILLCFSNRQSRGPKTHFLLS